jgi:hypothetical protein
MNLSPQFVGFLDQALTGTAKHLGPHLELGEAFGGLRVGH